MTKLYFVEISEIICLNIFKKLLPSVSRKKQEQNKRFYFDIDKKLSLYSELLVRLIICEILNIRNKEIVLEKYENGKPYLKGYPNSHFNLSHTRNAIVVVVSDKLVGVDIEKIRTVDLKIVKRFFTNSEISYITKSDIDINKRFCEVWTKKETYIKYVGKGLSMQLKTFDVLDNENSKRIYTIENDDYIISVCSESPNEIYNIMNKSEKDIESKTMKFL